jgi:hypothetical protein
MIRNLTPSICLTKRLSLTSIADCRDAGETFLEKTFISDSLVTASEMRYHMLEFYEE